MADEPKDDLEGLEGFFRSDLSKAKKKNEEKPRERPNLITEAVMEASQKKPGRKTKPSKEKATKQVAGYVTPSVKEALDRKRGMVSESKVVAHLVKLYVEGKVSL